MSAIPEGEKQKDAAAHIKAKLKAACDLVLSVEAVNDKASESKRLLAAAELMEECLALPPAAGSENAADQATERFSTDVFAHDWGIIIPAPSGFVWQVQTGGVLCDQAFIEGVFIPLRRPRIRDENEPVDLLQLLQDANYSNEDTADIWTRIKAAMHFDFVVADAPNGEPQSGEGLLWVKFTKFDDGWGHGAWVKQLIGRTVVLIYPNCD